MWWQQFPMAVSYLSPEELEKRKKPLCSNVFCQDHAKFMIDRRNGGIEEEIYYCARCMDIVREQLDMILRMYREGRFDSQEKLDEAGYKI
jgi:late competence protein required for DNA uptake (superfamily II DNA/RNA helicase)